MDGWIDSGLNFTIWYPSHCLMFLKNKAQYHKFSSAIKHRHQLHSSSTDVFIYKCLWLITLLEPNKNTYFIKFSLPNEGHEGVAGVPSVTSQKQWYILGQSQQGATQNLQSTLRAYTFDLWDETHVHRENPILSTRISPKATRLAAAPLRCLVLPVS